MFTGGVPIEQLEIVEIACDNFLYGFKGAPAARQPIRPLGRIGRSKREVIGENA